MKLREPKLSVPNDEFDLSPTEQTITYEVTTITPIFGGGVEAGIPDEKMAIRASAIRGQMRYWWRFLVSNREIDPIDSKDHKALFKAERELWGGMAEEGEDYASKIFVRVHQKQVRSEPYNENQAGYALFPARSENNKPAKELIKEGIKFQLTIITPADQLEHIKDVVRWWMTFGGIGSRTRRGVGSVEMKEIIRPDSKIKVEPITKEEAIKHKCKLVFGKHIHSKPIDAWEEAVKFLQYFRQEPEPKGIGRNKGFGRSHWPEADSIREILKTHSNKHNPDHAARISFPRAYFGMPITFKFKDDSIYPADPTESQLQPQQSERLASPLILTPYRLPNDHYAPAALRLPYREIKDIKLHLKVGGEIVPARPTVLTQNEINNWQSKSWNNWQEDWWDKSKSKDVNPINANNLNGKYTNPLDAFMNYFGKAK